MRRALDGAGLYEFFEPQLLIYSSVVNLKKDSPKIFRLACRQAGFGDAPQRCLFVGESSAERAFALWQASTSRRIPAKAVTALTSEAA